MAHVPDSLDGAGERVDQPPLTGRLADANRRLRDQLGNVRIRDDIRFEREGAIDAVFEGGGALGAAFSGSIRLLEDEGHSFARVAGTSAGAITAALVAAGYNSREIDWLMSAYADLPFPSTNGRLLEQEGAQPIKFLQFLDIAHRAEDIDDSIIKRSWLYQTLSVQIMDRILDTALGLPSRLDLVDDAIQALEGVPFVGPAIGAALNVHRESLTDLREAIGKVLDFVPAVDELEDWMERATLRDFRETFALAACKALLDLPSLEGFFLRVSFQILHGGSLFLGDAFLETMRRLLEARVPHSGGKVRFADLEVPLTVIAANLRTRQLEFYSTGKTPTMEVAEAVRRSMSIPLAFEPQGGLIVDGGIYANFPAFTLTEEFDGLWPPESISHTRPKVGFALDDAAMAPNSWRLARAKFQPKGDPPAVDFLEVLEGILLAAVGLDQFNLRGFRMPDVEVMAPVKFLEVALETGAGRRNVQDVTRKLLATSMFATAPYFDVSIPLNGFHWLDFAVNLKKDDLDSIRQRGWRATVEELAAPSSGDEPLIGGEGRTRINPYGPRPGEGLSQDLEARVSALEADMQTLKDFRELVLLGAHRLSGGQVPLQRGDAHLLPLNGGGQGEVSPAGGDVTDPAELPPEPAMDPSLNG